MLPLTCCRLVLRAGQVQTEPACEIYACMRAQLSPSSTGGLVVLGQFGSGKSYLCDAVARSSTQECSLPATVVPLRDVARHGEVSRGLERVVGPHRLKEAREGERVLLLDGLDEIPHHSLGSSHAEAFASLIGQVGPRWILTSRPGYFRTEHTRSEEQVDCLDRPDVQTVVIQALSPDQVGQQVADIEHGQALLESVDNLGQLATSPLLLEVVRAAAPYIEPGRPIDGWGLFDAWIRHSLCASTRDLHALEALAWAAWNERGLSIEVPTFCPSAVANHRLPISLHRGLFVRELDGRLRFGHRSVYEFLLASRLAPRLQANQGQGPDELTGARITEAVRAFSVGRTGPMPVDLGPDWVRIPRGNFIAGGDVSADERPLRIAHLARPVQIARAPVTQAEWAEYLLARPDDRIDAHYLPHWGADRRLPADGAHLPVYSLWPRDADAYAAWRGARLPTADEWEKAARGLDGRRWPWGDHWRPNRACTAELGTDRPVSVRGLGAHGDAQLYSASGGVFETTSSWYRGRTDRGRVLMGGAYTHPAPVSRVSLRLSHRLSGHLKAGLRLARSV